MEGVNFREYSINELMVALQSGVEKLGKAWVFFLEFSDLAR
jgi:hypothetical protein